MTSEGAVRTGRDAAARRIERTMARAQHVDLTSLIVGLPGDAVEEARGKATDAAIMAGRGDLVAAARRDASAWVLQAFATRGYSGTWAWTEMSMSVARPKDRAAVAEGLADAVTADAVEDLVEPEIAETLRSTWSVVAESAAIPEPGAISGLTASLVGPRTRPGAKGLVIAGLVFVLGLWFLAIASPIGIGLLLAAAWVLRNAVRGRAS
jgi:hypothetical protein